MLDPYGHLTIKERADNRRRQLAVILESPDPKTAETRTEPN
jgi:hypothetical protein